MARLRQLRGPAALVVSGGAIGLALFHLYVAYYGIETTILKGVHLGVATALIGALYPAVKGSRMDRIGVTDALLAIGGLAASAYWIYINITNIVVIKMGDYDFLDKFMALAMVLVVLEITRRTIGWPLPVLAAIFLIYPLVGPYLPAFLAHRGYSLDRTFGQAYFVTEGIWGVPLGVSASYVILFIIFGAFLQASGGGQFFIDLAYSLVGRVRGGAAKVSVISSSLFGTISGSAVANVVVDGWLTIPLMKRSGFQPHVAGAVEATASTGGQIMPPVMGAAAFIIAEIVGVPYAEVAIAAAIPAILYYVALFAMVDLEAAKHNIRGLPAAELPDARKIILEGWHLLVPLLALVYLLIIVEWSPPRAAFFAVIGCVVASWVRRATRMGPFAILRALEQGARGALEVAATCACAGLVIGSVMLTGLGMKLSEGLIQIAGDNLLALLLLTMVSSVILGMGLPTTAAYVILAVLVAPAIIKMGVLPLAAHLFVFYFGCISAITPPVALAAYAAAGLAATDPFRTGFASVRLGLAGFIVPFMFVYGPAMLMRGTPLEVLAAFVSGVVGSCALAAAVQGWLLTRLNPFQRALLVIAALNLIHVGLLTDLVGYGLVGITVAWHAVGARRSGRRAGVFQDDLAL